MDTRDRKFGGHLALDGASLTFFKTAIDTLSAKLNLKATELEIEQLEMKRKNDSLSGQGKIDMSHEHNYSGTLEARADNVLDYFSAPRGAAVTQASAIPVDIQATINSSKWDACGTLQVPNSSPISFTANFPLSIGTDWDAFQVSPLNITLDFPSIFLASAPQFFQPEIFQDGILSGNISLSETLQRPRIVGDIQLVNGKLCSETRALFNLIEASSRIAFTGNRASLEFLNVATKDVDLSVTGEIEFPDTNDVTVRIAGATPIFDLMLQPIDCVNKIEIAPAALALAPAVEQVEFHGSIFRSDWTIDLKERTSIYSFGNPNLDGADHKFSLCFSGAEGITLLLGAPPRPEEAREPMPPKKRAKRGQ